MTDLIRNFVRRAVIGCRIVQRERIAAGTGGISTVGAPTTAPVGIPMTVQVSYPSVSSTAAPASVSISPISAEKIVAEKVELVESGKGIEVPEIIPKVFTIESEMPEPERKISMIYPLIPKKPKKGEPIFAYTKIFWDKNAHRYIYQLVEPQLTPKIKDNLDKVIELLEQKLDVDFSKLKKFEAIEYLEKQVADILKFFGFNLTETEIKILNYYIRRNFIGLGRIEPLIQDPYIEDISCDGVNIPIFIFHRNPVIGSLISNISFENQDELDSFIIRLAQLCGKSISVSNPLLAGSLPDGSRVQATLATDIARRGSNFTIRKFTTEPFTPVHLLNYGTIDVKSLAYLWFMIDHGRSILISGGTATGKTTFLNMLSLFIRPERKIVSIEDTPELILPHIHWVPTVARTAIATGKTGEVDLFDLLKESLRQRPDYIIVGEVRGKEAYILFQQMATGHPSLATIHAENIHKLSDRLTTPPISLPPSLMRSLDIIVFLSSLKYKNHFVRKMIEILEITGFDPKTKMPTFNQVYKWNPIKDKFDRSNPSILLQKVSELSGIKERKIKEEIEKRMVVLQWMKDNNISNYRDVYKILSIFYGEPEKLLSIIRGV
ncbi:MAG: type II/IV secretion system ATPase subunit [Candidatus Aenigmatarchaeota archaeon]